MKPYRLLWLWVVLVTACAQTGVTGAPASSPTWAFTMRDVKFPMRDFRFPSGLRVVVESDPRLPLVAVTSVVGVGSVNDPPGKEGLAHYVEHLTFRAKPDGKATIETLLGQAGAGSHNATTSFDRTTYYAIGPREALPGLLLVEALRLMAPVDNVAPETASVEREVVRNELRVRGETGYVGAAFAALQGALFPEKHPYRRPVIGTHDSLSSMTLEDARTFAKAHYRPDNTTIVIVGDIDLGTVLKDIEGLLPAEVKAGSAPKQDKPRLAAVSPAPPDPPAGELVRAQANVPTPELWIGWTLPRGYDVDSVLLQAVTRAARSTLPRAFRSDTDIAGIQVFQVEGAEASILVCRLTLQTAAHPERSVTHVLDQAMWIWAPPSNRNDVAVGMQAASFQQFQRTVATSMLFDAESLLSRAEERAVAAHFAGDPLIYSRKLGAALSLSFASVSEYAAKYVTQDRARAVLLTPSSKGSKDPASAVPPDPNAEPAPAPPDAETMRAFGRPLGAKGFRELTLPNGLQVILAERSGMPLATVGLSFRKSQSVGPGAAELVDMLASPKVATKIVPGQFGSVYWETTTRDTARYFMRGSSGNVSEMLSLLSDWVSGMTVRSTDVDNYFRDTIGARAVAEGSAASGASRSFWSALYPDHPYGKTALTADLQKQDAGKANDWLSATIAAKNGTLVVVGEIDVDAVESLVRSSFGGLREGQAQEVPAPLPLPPRAGPRSSPSCARARHRWRSISAAGSPRPKAPWQSPRSRPACSPTA
ncbi:MAG: insulinase family protein [Polyangiaceae bacterium]